MKLTSGWYPKSFDADSVRSAKKFELIGDKEAFYLHLLRFILLFKLIDFPGVGPH